MRFAKPILMALMALALAVYAFECLAMSTPEDAMQCCDSMPCSSHGPEHSQDCCKTMPSMHATFVQPSSLQDTSFSPVFLAALPDVIGSEGLDSPVDILAAHWHAPPIPHLAALSPLRI
jgi:hypothetical protein